MNINKNNYFGKSMGQNTMPVSETGEFSGKSKYRNVLSRFFRQLVGTKKRISAILILIIIVVGGYMVYQKYFNLTPAEKAQKELATAVVAVSKHMLLPEGDQPVLATVTDAKTLMSQQAFFNGAVNGDELLLFPRSLKAVLYSPSRNIIVNTGPIQQSSAQTGATTQSNAQASVPIASAVATAILSVEVRNGTGKTGYASTIADQIRGNADYTITKVTDANKKDYAKTIIFSRVNDDSKKQTISSLVAALRGDLVATLPSGEKSTDADVLVILGGNE